MNIEQCQLWTSIVIQVLKFNLIFISWMGCGLQGAEWSRWQTGSDWEVGRELSLPWALLVRSYHHRCLLFCPNFSVSLAPLPPEWPSVLILATVLLSTTHECFAFGSQLLNLAWWFLFCIWYTFRSSGLSWHCFFFFFLFVVDFVIHWNETAMGLHVFPIPIPPLSYACLIFFTLTGTPFTLIKFTDLKVKFDEFSIRR